ncbi:fatty acid hydroxylase domain-containing protein 2-like [Saccoglossus kowalevskii]
MDLTTKPKFLWKYKIQQDKNAPLDPARLPGLFKTTIFNMVALFPVISMILYTGGQFRGSSCSVEDLPSLPRFLLDFVAAVLGEEVFFYYSHRLFHNPYFYKRFHKKHHEWTAPIGLVAIYAHPVEHLLSNTLPLFAGPFIMGSHLLSVWVWVIVALITTTITHSGYHFPFMASPQFHDFHHAKFNYCFGVLGICDYIHGTDSLFRKSKASERNMTFFSLKPIHERIPDDNALKKD